MNKHVILLSAAAVLLFSCSREADQAILPGETITFTAAWAGADETRTILQSDGTSVWWDAAEQINVFFSDKASGKFTSTNSQPQAIVDFQGSLPIVVGSVETENPAHAYWAVYPYNTANTCDGESVTLTVPSTQTAKEGTFADKMFPSIATSTNFYLAFYNVCGGVRFTVANEEIASVTFKANNGESLAGKVKVGFEGVPVVKSVVEGVSEVVVNAPTGGFVPGKYYFAALLPQTLSKGMSLTFKKEDGKVASTSLENSITINRSRFGKMEEKDNGLEFKDDGSGHNPTDNIVFADEALKIRLVARFDSNDDGELSYEEAAAVTSIEGVLSIKTISSFDEFQFFTGVKTIPNDLFREWTELTCITLPPNIISIGRMAFYGCSSLKSIIIPERVSSLGAWSFAYCPNLESIVIPEGISKFEIGVFEGCSGLKSIVLPESVTNIGDQFFMGCSNLVTVRIPESVTSIGASAFLGCSSLTSVNIPEGVTSINLQTFADCSSLESIVIPDSVTSFGGSAFRGCSSLQSIVIPENVTSITWSAFSGCSSLVSITIPEKVTSIGDSAFSDCTSLISAIIPESVTKIEWSAFSGCSSIVSIIIPKNVTSIGDKAFSGCSGLTSITVLPGLPPTGGGALMFDNTNNAPIYVPTRSVEIYRTEDYWSTYADRIQAIHE